MPIGGTIRSGKYREVLWLQMPVGTQDAYGAVPLVYSQYATVRAAVIPLSGQDLWQAQQVRPEVTTRVEMRYYPGVEVRHRFVYAKATNRVLNILYIFAVDEINAEMQMLCRELVLS